MGTMDSRTVCGDIIGAGIVAEKKIIPTIPADQNRHALTKDQMIGDMEPARWHMAGLNGFCNSFRMGRKRIN
jgi:hypothetical protein